jgi:hypothetical protein
MTNPRSTKRPKNSSWFTPKDMRFTAKTDDHLSTIPTYRSSKLGGGEKRSRDLQTEGFVPEHVLPRFILASHKQKPNPLMNELTGDTYIFNFTGEAVDSWVDDLGIRLQAQPSHPKILQQGQCHGSEIHKVKNQKPLISTKEITYFTDARPGASVLHSFESICENIRRIIAEDEYTYPANIIIKCINGTTNSPTFALLLILAYLFQQGHRFDVAQEARRTRQFTKTPQKLLESLQAIIAEKIETDSGMKKNAFFIPLDALIAHIGQGTPENRVLNFLDHFYFALALGEGKLPIFSQLLEHPALQNAERQHLTHFKTILHEGTPKEAQTLAYCLEQDAGKIPGQGSYIAMLVDLLQDKTGMPDQTAFENVQFILNLSKEKLPTFLALFYHPALQGENRQLLQHFKEIFQKGPLLKAQSLYACLRADAFQQNNIDLIEIIAGLLQAAPEDSNILKRIPALSEKELRAFSLAAVRNKTDEFFDSLKQSTGPASLQKGSVEPTTPKVTRAAAAKEDLLSPNSPPVKSRTQGNKTQTPLAEALQNLKIDSPTTLRQSTPHAQAQTNRKLTLGNEELPPFFPPYTNKLVIGASGPPTPTASIRNAMQSYGADLDASASVMSMDVNNEDSVICGCLKIIKSFISVNDRSLQLKDMLHLLTGMHLKFKDTDKADANRDILMAVINLAYNKSGIRGRISLSPDMSRLVSTLVKYYQKDKKIILDYSTLLSDLDSGFQTQQRRSSRSHTGSDAASETRTMMMTFAPQQTMWSPLVKSATSSSAKAPRHSNGRQSMSGR